MRSPQFVLISSPMGNFSPYNSGAIATWLVEVGRHAQRAGFSPLVIARRSKAEPYSDVPAKFVTFPSPPANAWQLKLRRIERKLNGWPQFGHATYARRVAALLRREKLEGVPWMLSNDPELAVYLRQQFPSAYIVHHFQNQMESRKKWKDAFPESVNKVTACSQFTVDWIEKYYGRLEGKTAVIYNAVAADDFYPAPEEISGPPVINFVGRTGIEKAPDLLLRASLELKRSGRDFKVQIVGSNHWGPLEMDDYQRELARLSEELVAVGVEVRRPGHVERADLPEVIRRAHIHVVPSRWDEPFGMTTVEGMASGLATVGSNTGGTPEVIGDAGLLFERDNASDLADQLRKLTDDPDLRREYAKKGREKALSFSWENTWQGVCQALELN